MNNSKILSIIIKAQDKASDVIEHVGDKVSSVSKQMVKVTAVAAAATASAFAALGVSAMKSAGEYEQSRVAFNTMLGSADKARGLMEDIAKFAKSTPFELPEVVAGTKQLLAFGFAQEDLLPTMRKLGDLASGLGVPIGQLTNVYGQVRVAGRLMGQDLLQFTNAGVPMIEALATTMKKPQSEIKKLVEDGKIGFPQVEAALNSLTGEGSKFGGMMETQSQTFNGVVSNLKDGFGQILRSAVGMTAAGDIVKGSLFDRIRLGAQELIPILTDFGERIGPMMETALNRLDVVVTTVVGKFREWWPVIQEVGIAVAEYLGPKLGALWDTITGKLIPALTKFWKEVVEPLIPVIGTLLVAAIGLAIDAITWITDVVSALIDGFTILWTEIQNGNPFIWGLIGVFGTLAAAMAFNAVFNALSVGFATLTLVTIPSVMTSVGLLQAAILAPIVMPAILVGAAIAAVMSVIWVLQDMKKEAQAAQKYADESIYNSKNANRSRPSADASGTITQGYSLGGYTGKGGKYDIAGVVHRGEYVVPKDMVDQNTGLPFGATAAPSFTFTGPMTFTSAESVDRFFEQTKKMQELGNLGVGV